MRKPANSCATTQIISYSLLNIPLPYFPFLTVLHDELTVMSAAAADVLVVPDDVHIVDDNNNSAITISSRAQSPVNLPIVLPPPEQHPPPSKPSSSSSKVVSTKPKSVRHKPRTPSPSPPPPPPQPPRQTIRLDIKLGGPSNYEVDISFLSKETGQRPPTPIPVKRDTSESEGDDDEKIKDGLRPPRKRKVCRDSPRSFGV